MSAPSFPPAGVPPRVFMPPTEDFWIGSPHAGPLDALVAQSILDARVEESGGRRQISGKMNFSNPTLTGPPGRLHGGLHCVARVFPILERLRPSEGEGAFPCAIHLKLGKAIPMAETVGFAAATGERAGGGWWMTSRFLESERLDAAAWSLPKSDLHGGSIISSEKLSHWKARYQKALGAPELGRRRMFGVDYAGCRDLFWASIPGAASLTRDFLKRFSAGEGFYGPAFACFHLDNTGAIATAIEAMCPHFTTRLALRFAAARIPATGPLLFLADRSGRASEPHAKSKPVTIDGRPWGTVRTEVLLASADFSKAWAWGYVAAHPIDYSKMAASFQAKQG